MAGLSVATPSYAQLGGVTGAVNGSLNSSMRSTTDLSTRVVKPRAPMSMSARAVLSSRMARHVREAITAMAITGVIPTRMATHTIMIITPMVIITGAARTCQFTVSLKAAAKNLRRKTPMRRFVDIRHACQIRGRRLTRCDFVFATSTRRHNYRCHRGRPQRRYVC